MTVNIRTTLSHPQTTTATLQTQMEGANGNTNVHAVSSGDSLPHLDAAATSCIHDLSKSSSVYHARVIARAAFALTQAQDGDVEDIMLQVVAMDQCANLAALLPPPKKIGLDQSIGKLLQSVQDLSDETRELNGTVRDWVWSVSQEDIQRCSFKTVLATESDEMLNSESHLYHQLAMMIRVDLTGNKLELCARFGSKMLDRCRVERILERLIGKVRQLSDQSNATTQIAELSLTSNQDLKETWSWNAVVPAAVDARVHDLISQTAQLRLEAPAVCAWDGSLTYSQLDALSTKLAAHLIRLGVKAEIVVPLCFEKSMWTPVAMLAVMKAGGASVLLDVSQPEDRLRSIVGQVSPVVLLASAEFTSRAVQLSTVPVVVVDRASVAALTPYNVANLPEGSSNDTLYLVFTSGSTGTPKGATITHSNAASAIRLQKKLLKMDATSRVYDFVSYAFDVVWGNFLHAFTAGACLCIPSEEDRRTRISESANEMKANWIHVTPTVCRLLDFSILQNIDILVFSGEPLNAADLRLVPSSISVLNLYGPAECTVDATVKDIGHDRDCEPSIGHAMACCTWVVHPRIASLVPLGCVGELWLEGPIVGRGYYNDTAKTAAAFIEDPPWLTRGAPGHPGRRGRLYRTGDLVRYESDGSLSFVGRKDSQVKIRGQRVELGEIEHHVRRLLNFIEENDGNTNTLQPQVVVEVVTPESSDRVLLVAFVSPGSSWTAHNHNTVEGVVQQLTRGIETRLLEALPAYMIPTAYVPIHTIPLTTTGKTDRGQLRNIGTALSREQLERLSRLHAGSNREPSTPMEKEVQKLWASVLSVDAAVISADSTFFGLGGDSITAMQLVREAQSCGLSLTVANILRHARLSDLAKKLTIGQDSIIENIPPLSLLEQKGDQDTTRKQAAQTCGTDPERIQDVLPCTPLQEGLLALTADRPGDYVSTHVIGLSRDIDLGRFQQAWDTVVSAYPILRTRIIHLPQQGLVQVVQDECPISWTYGDNVEEVVKLCQQPMGLETPLSYYGIVRHDRDDQLLFIWTIHHAIYDGWSFKLIMDAVYQAYHGRAVQADGSFRRFIKYIQSVDEVEASSYWRSQLEGLNVMQFPALPSSSYRPKADSTILQKVENISWASDRYPIATVIRTAWALTQATYTGENQVIFGSVVTGRQAPMYAIDSVVGPTLATVPVRVDLDPDHTVEMLIQQVFDHAVGMVPYEQIGLQSIRRLGEEAGVACGFQTQLVIQPQTKGSKYGRSLKELSTPGLHKDSADDFIGETELNESTYGITLEVELDGRAILLKTRFDSGMIQKHQVQSLMDQLSHVISQLCVPANKFRKLCEVELLSDKDLNDIWSWNANPPAAVHARVHDLIGQVTRRQPMAPAVCAWDGSLTYSQLDSLSGKLAAHLIDLGVKAEDIVPLCFEKSMWTSVAMLAVMKAGGASVLLDVSQPEDRLRSIVAQVSPMVVLASAESSVLALRLSLKPLVVVDGTSVESLSPHDLKPISKGSFDDTLYLVFTSGSTGTPKGATITHSNAASAIYHQKSSLRMDSTSRIFDFASYAFDASWWSFLHILTAGGCLCVPSEEDRRSRISQCASEMRVNYMPVTPTVSRMLDFSTLQDLKVFVFCGEPLNVSDLRLVPKPIFVLNLYGPAECTVDATAREIGHDRNAVPGIGYGVGCRTWIVQSGGDTLVPIGCVGELWIEGPIVGRGYYNDANKTAAAFIEDPSWLTRGAPGHPGRRGRLYRTGDLVRYEADGSLSFVGRKDSQVKIRGQRVELGEVENYVKRYINSTKIAGNSNDAQVVAEVLTPQGSDRPLLVAFVSPAAQGKGDESIQTSVQQLISGIHNGLLEVAPAYMIPTIYIPVAEMPLSTTGKMDRNKLRNIGRALNKEQLKRLSKSQAGPYRQASSVIEKKLQQLWASVLAVDATKIGADDTFFGLGGDSITAMQLVSEARLQGLSLTVAAILRHPKLSSQAKELGRDEDSATEDIPPLSLLSETIANLITTREQAAQVCGTPVERIQDVLPCTPLQEGMLALTVSRPGDYISTHVITLNREVDVELFKGAWEALVSAFPILRTRIIHLPQHGLVQVVHDSRANWINGEDIKEVVDLCQQPMCLGSQLLYYGIVRGDCQRQASFVLNIHHALYDGWSFQLMLDAVYRAYGGQVIKAQETFRGFIKYIRSIDQEEASVYWQSQFEGLAASQFPTLPSLSYKPRADATVAQRVENVLWTSDQYTIATAIRTAWALTQSTYTGEDQVVFGCVVTGRQAPVRGIESIVGPTLATVPIRVNLDPDSTFDILMQQVLDQAVGMVPYEQTGLQAIGKLSDQARMACDFQTQLIIHAGKEMADSDLRLGELSTFMPQSSSVNEANDRAALNMNSYALVITVEIQESVLSLKMSFDSHAIESRQAERLMGQLALTVSQLCELENTSKKISDLPLLSAQDLNDIWSWNADVPARVDGCVQDLIVQRAYLCPEAPAICAWDGNLTYARLDTLSTMLATHLIDHGIKPECIVPLCFEKSMWTPVAMLAVMKAGGTSVLLDVSQPEDRLRSIVAQLSPVVVLATAHSSSLALRLSLRPVLAADKVLSEALPARNLIILPKRLPHNTLYIVFTSGSTGTPKGARITDANAASAVYHQKKYLRMDSTRRVYDFASYAFDIAWGNFLHTLAVGGCLCVPSEEDRRSRISESAYELRANYLHVTPTICRLLDFSVLHSVEVLALSGEALSATDLQLVPSSITVLNLYGPAECTILSTARDFGYDRHYKPGIGHAIACCTWVVHPREPSLMPVGGVGELWLEGPIVGRGYYNDTAKTAAAFIEDPPWLTRGAPGHPGRRGRLYRTGDLVRYESDGSLSFVGRKDSQVKIRGQRVELGDIEYHVQRLLGATGKENDSRDAQRAQVVAEVVTPQGSNRPLLVAFVAQAALDADDKSLENVVQQLTRGIHSRLLQVLPAYMIPTAYIPVLKMPLTATGKTDRRHLRSIGSTLHKEELERLSKLQAGPRQQPSTVMEKQLQQLWASVLAVDTSEISADDTFFGLGGDSIAAIQLVSEARLRGFSLTVTAILRHARLSDLAQQLKMEEDSVIEHVPALSLLADDETEQMMLKAQAAKSCRTTMQRIQDVLPCTPLQEGLLALTVNRPGDYTSTHVITLSPDTDVGRFQTAWDTVVSAFPILRTRIIHLPQYGLVQVVEENSQINWICGEDIDEVVKLCQQPIGLGSLLSCYGIVRSRQGSRVSFVWSIHHALYDGWSFDLILDAVYRAYHGQIVEARESFRTFVKYILRIDQNETSLYWKSQFEGLAASQFPTLPSPSFRPKADSLVRHQVDNVSWTNERFTIANIIRTAWALTQATYTGEDEAIFGCVLTGRQTPLRGIESVVGPTLATVPVRVGLNPDHTVEMLVRQILTQAIDMVPYEQMGLQSIRKLSEEAGIACGFQTQLVIQSDTKARKSHLQLGELSITSSQDQSADQIDDKYALKMNSYGLMIEVKVQGSAIRLDSSFDSKMLERQQVETLMSQFIFNIRHLINPANWLTKLSELRMVSDEDMKRVWSLNADVPTAVDAGVHDLIVKMAQCQPTAPAICAWDGNLTYTQLDALSSTLAAHLIRLGVKVEVVVPLCCEKSMWTPVSMLAVMKTGGTSVLLDVSQPEDRLSSIVGQVSPQLILASAGSSSLAARLSTVPVFVVDAASVAGLPLRDPALLPEVLSDTVLYLVFTSGSTGTPKGATITHSNAASAIYHQRRPLRMDSTRRVYDFASYAFDIAWGNFLHTLTAGGCLCIPSEDDRRSRISQSVNELQANYLHFTPTVCRLLDFSVLQGVEVFAFSGEPLNTSVLRLVPSSISVLDLYGPAECTILSTAKDFGVNRDSKSCIGYGIGCRTWVVYPGGTSLVPLGCVGELWLEGPIVGQGYYNDPDKTAAAFVENPSWLTKGAPGFPGRHGRLYRTGDLVRYEADGSLSFIGRKDSQVKIRGQRVELGEIEHHVRRLLNGLDGTDSNDAHVVAEVLTPQGSDRLLLVAFVCPASLDAEDDEDDSITDTVVQRLTQGIEKRLLEVLPVYMIPTVYIPVRAMPLTATGKTNRRRLISIGTALSKEQLKHLSRSQIGPRKEPSTIMERELQQLWASVLSVEATEISADDTFFSLGGDSILAMQLASKAQSQGFSLTVPAILRHAQLESQAKQLRKDSDFVIDEIPPFSLLDENQTIIREQAANACGTTPERIHDVLPCTPLQEGLLALTENQPGDYVRTHVMVLSQEVDMERFKKAWDTVFCAFPILRTRIIHLPRHGFVQVVQDSRISWTYSADIQGVVDLCQQPMGLGRSLSYYGIIRQDRDAPSTFVWTLHHALYDGWSIELILDAVYESYHGQAVETRESFRGFVKHVRGINQGEASSYWRSQFEDLIASPFPALPSSSYRPKADSTHTQQLDNMSWRSERYTIATVVRSAWALTQATYTGEDQVIFGCVVTGRQVPVRGIDSVVGPTLATVPVRVHLSPGQTVEDLRQQVFDQAVDMVPYEQMGLQAIRKVGEEANMACDFQTQLVVQPGNRANKSRLQLGELSPSSSQDHYADEIDDEHALRMNSYGLMVQVEVQGNAIQLNSSFDSRMIGKQQVKRLMNQFSHTVRQLLSPSNGSKKLSELELLSDQDQEDIWSWNADVPAKVEARVHDMVVQTAQIRPEAPAICAWDGNLTYGQLDALSNKLAAHLVDLGVKAEVVVPLCFEKSMWTPVAMLAVMKAGGVSVLLDVTQPEGRLCSIVAQVSPVVVLTSTESSHLALRLSSTPLVVVDRSFTETLPNRHPALSTEASSNNALYLVFTSGSTGTPKGATITHSNAASAIYHQKELLKMDATSRVYDFVSYAFDVAWGNFFHTLTAGACLCIPSEDDRRTRISESARELRANWIHVTPTVCRLLDFSILQDIDVFVFSGEPLSSADLQLVPSTTVALNLYGPAECTVDATVRGFGYNRGCETSIGFAMGCCTWVVHPGGTSLVPLGCVGELWLEGPIVGRGYYDDPDKTAASFIEDPLWLSKGAPGFSGRHGRLYRTGDLVRYEADGSLSFIGRKDSQVKIRGQRVELGEVEHHVRGLLNSTEMTGDTSQVQVVVEVLTPQGSDRPLLAAFVSLGSSKTAHDNSITEAVVQRLTKGIENRLLELLPSYMIPTVYIPVGEMPLTITGKTDRRQLRQSWLSKILSYSKKSQPLIHEVPKTLAEQILLDAWADTLNLAKDDISTTDSFTRLGGDSITAMQVIARCRVHDLTIKTRDILHLKTIQKIAEQAFPCPKSKESDIDMVFANLPVTQGSYWGVSPIQGHLLNKHPTGIHHYNQSFLLKVTEDVSPSRLFAAVAAVVRNHEMLRARFSRTLSGDWEQYVPTNKSTETLYGQELHKTSTTETIKMIAQRRQESLDISVGPVFAVDIFQATGHPLTMLFTGHHLVVDLVSWRIIWHEIEEFILNKPTLRAPVTFRQWCELQQHKSITIPPETVLPFPLRQANLDFWDTTELHPTAVEFNEKIMWIDAAATSLLMRDANDTYRTQPTDIMLAALIRSFQIVFTERNAPPVFFEGHGRESIDDLEVDLSQTVGWFTTLVPIQLATASGSIIDAVREVKDVRKNTRNNGLSYFGFSHYSKEGRACFGHTGPLEITFNYQGQFQQLEEGESMFVPVDTKAADFQSQANEARATSLVNVEVSVHQGRLKIDCAIFNRLRHYERVHQWLEEFADCLRTVSRTLPGLQLGYSLSDFPLLDMSYRGLDTLTTTEEPTGSTGRAIREIYPCTLLQEGILLSQKLGHGSYLNYWSWMCQDFRHGVASSSVSVKALEKAWETVIQRHSIFSTTFGRNPDDNKPVQILWETTRPRIRKIKSTTTTARSVLDGLESPTFQSGEPEYLVTICLGKDGDVGCRLDMSHTLSDATSASIIVNQLRQVYNGEKLAAMPLFRDAVEVINQTPSSEIQRYWNSFMENAQPTCLPTSHQPATSELLEASHVVLPLKIRSANVIHDYCHRHDMTRSTFLQIAWALMLSFFTGTESPCFGYIASGRDLAIDGVESLVGPLINMLVSYIDLSTGLAEVLARTNADAVEHLNHQHMSLAQLQHDLGLKGRQLFNTSLSVRNSLHQASPQNGFDMVHVNSGDRHEYDFSLAAGIDKGSLEVGLIFKTDTVNSATAHEVLSVTEAAVNYLLDYDKSSATTANLANSFFNYISGQSRKIAADFWNKYLQGSMIARFPLLSRSKRQPCVNTSVAVTIAKPNMLNRNFNGAAALQAAVGLAHAQYTNAGELIIGVATPSRHTTSSIAVPLRISVDEEQEVQKYLQAVQSQSSKIEPFTMVTRHWIRTLSKETAMGCDFDILIISESDKQLSNDDGFSRSFAIVFYVRANGNNLDIKIGFDSEIIESRRVGTLMGQLTNIVRQLYDPANESKRLSDLEIIPDQDLRDIWSSNSSVPMTVDLHVHNLIGQVTRSQLEAPAICAWDGNLTYGQLDALSNKLAAHLVDLGVKAEVVVPLCFEKSMWTPVAMLAVMKTGGASVLLDVSQPEDRLRSTVKQVSPVVVLSSAESSRLALRLSSTPLVVVDRSFTERLPNRHPTAISEGYSDDALYLVFTSGSTGTPKGVTITHSNAASAIYHQQDFLRMESGRRVYDFASYAFDIAWGNFLHTLAAGGCLCIPSEEDRRSRISESASEMRVNHILVTPTVCRQLDFSILPLVDVLVLGGELITPSDLQMVPSSIRVFIAYGPAECTINATVRDFGYDRDSEPSIGYSIGCRTWVVHPRGTSLVPLGCVGELWLEGPIVGRSYYDDPDKTAASFIEDPLWLTKGAPGFSGRHGRLYRTGDLVRYEADGSLRFIGRKDSQVKIRGQRVELGEIEHHVRRLLNSTNGTRSNDAQVVAEMLTLPGSERPMLVAFISQAVPDTGKDSTAAAVQQLTSGIHKRLLEVLPAYMIPTVYIPISEMPLTTTGKTDRRQLRNIGSALSKEQLDRLSRSQAGPRRQPSTMMEKELQQLWASVLAVNATEISADDTFFGLGGDSITAMQLVSEARVQGFSLTVAATLRHAQLSELAQQMLPLLAETYRPSPPYSLVTKAEKDIISNLDFHWHPSKSVQVIDAYPLSYMQQTFVDPHLGETGYATACFFMELPQNIDPMRFESSCREMVNHFDILRTIFVPVEGRFCQIVLDQMHFQIQKSSVEDIEAATLQLSEDELPESRTLIDMHLLRHASSQVRFVLRVSHALYDGISIHAMFSSLGDFYSGRIPAEMPQYADFIRHTALSSKSSFTYWRSLLQGSALTGFNATPGLFAVSDTMFTVDRTVPIPEQYTAVHTTQASLFTAACAMMLFRVLGTRDVVFGRLVSGRAGLVSPLDRVAGPAFNVVPVRVTLNGDTDVDEALTQVHDQFTRGLTHHSVGFNDIRDECTSWSPKAMTYGLVTQFENIEHAPIRVDGADIPMENLPQRLKSRVNSAHLLAVPTSDSLKISLFTIPAYCSVQTAETMLEELCVILSKCFT